MGLSFSQSGTMAATGSVGAGDEVTVFGLDSRGLRVAFLTSGFALRLDGAVARGNSISGALGGALGLALTDLTGGAAR